jgi:hypothetical protein
MKEFNIDELEVVGYADVIDTEFAPQVVAPIYRLRGPVDVILMPPFQMHNHRVSSEATCSSTELKCRISEKMATDVHPGFPAKFGYCLWVDAALCAHYQPEPEVRRSLCETSSRSLQSALAALHQGDVMTAQQHAQRAINADGRSLSAIALAAVVKNLSGKSAEVDFLRKMARTIAPDVDFSAMLETIHALASCYGKIAAQVVHTRKPSFSLPVQVSNSEGTHANDLGASTRPIGYQPSAATGADPFAYVLTPAEIGQSRVTQDKQRLANAMAQRSEGKEFLNIEGEEELDLLAEEPWLHLCPNVFRKVNGNITLNLWVLLRQFSEISEPVRSKVIGLVGGAILSQKAA